MKRRIASALLLAMGIIIALGSYGHSFLGRRNIDRELDKFAIVPNVYTMLYVVWYFVGGSMLLFGMTIIDAWYRTRRREPVTMLPVYLIGLLYLASGVGGMIYRNGDPFMATFAVEGAAVLYGAYALTRA